MEIQNEIINLISDSIKSCILNMVNKAKYYSIILDYNPDLSHNKQMTIIIHFVFSEQSNNESNNNESNISIKEHFLGFVPIQSSTGMSISDVLVVNDTVNSSLETIAIVDTIQKVYVFFLSSTHRWQILLNNISNLTVKNLSQTR